MAEEPTGRAAVAVGASREAATQAFGRLFDDLVVTTYDDLADEVELGTAATVAIAEGSGAEQVLRDVLAGSAGTPVVVEVSGDPAGRAWLGTVLRDHPEVGVVGASHDHGARTVLFLGPAGPDAVSGPAVTTLLAALPDTSGPQPVWPEPAAVRTHGDGAPASVPARPRQAARPQNVRRLPRVGRRGALLLGAVAAAAVVALLVLVLIGRSDLGADGVIVTLLLGLTLVEVLTIAGVAYVARELRRGRAETAEFRERISRRTRRLVGQGVAARKRSAALKKAAAREQQHHEYVVELGRQLNRSLRQAQVEAPRLHLATQRQTQALLNLGELVRLDAAVPPAGGWAASPDLLLYCVDTVLAEKPSLVVECGSGLSTLFLSLAAVQHDLPTRIVALEHDERFAVQTRALLERHGVGDRAEVRVAPLQPTSLPGHETAWYAESALDGLTEIGVLLVDGPPTATGPQARFPAVPLLQDRLAARCTIVMDDLIRESDHETAERWAELLPDFDYSVIREFEKHVGILRRR